LGTLYDQQRHLVISGGAGVGKSALLLQAHNSLPLLICNESSTLEQCCEELATQLALRLKNQSIDERIARISSTIGQAGRPTAFDQFDQPPPTLAKFVGELTHIAPVWIVTRSTPSQGLGSLSEQLHEFAHLEIGPFKRTDIRMLIARAVEGQLLHSFTIEQVGTFYRLCQGNPRVLESLLRFVVMHKPECRAALKHCFDLWEKSQDCHRHHSELP